jgi:hypothetical protein
MALVLETATVWPPTGSGPGPGTAINSRVASRPPHDGHPRSDAADHMTEYVTESRGDTTSASSARRPASRTGRRTQAVADDAVP